MKKNFLSILVIFFYNLLFAFPNQFQMNPKVGTVPKELNESVFKDPKANLQSLVKTLTNGSNDDSTKVRIIHDWICNNITYDTDMYFSGRTSKQDYVSVLKKQKALCSGYSSVFIEMCKLANIEAKGIQGYSKGFGYTGKLGNKTDHEWNAVKIGNSWKLLDCCWDSGYVDYKTFIKKYSSEWFFLSPEKMLYSHLPENDEDQFVSSEKIKTKEQFVKEPYISGLFFHYGFEITDLIPDYSNEISDEVVFDFKITKKGVFTSSTLENRETKSRCKNLVWIDRKGSSYTYFYDVPDKKEYRGFIFARNNSNSAYLDKFTISEYEEKILPMVQSLVSEKPVSGKTISKTDFERFENAFFKSQDNGYYYYKENQFDAKQISTVKNVFKIINLESGYLETVLYFDIKASDSYTGCGNFYKYPNTYTTYNDTSNTMLLSPKCAVLSIGENVIFKFDSKDYSGMGISFGNELIPMTKNGTVFEYEGEIPEDCEKVIVYGTSNGKNYAGLLYYEVKQ